jgi:hypothetical protein
MDKDQLYQDLAKLVDEIDRLPLEDAESRKLHHLVSKLEDHVEGRVAEGGPQEIVDTVDQVISRLETDHPTFTGVLRRVMNALSSMGV